MSSDVRFDNVLAPDQVRLVAQVANVIWREHYTAIIGVEQVEYMLNKFQSEEAIGNELKNESARYYLIYSQGKVVGYIGLKFEELRLFLSKIYVLSSQRGQGVGKRAIEFVKDLAVSQGLDHIALTVNRHNSNTISAYKKIGFSITGDICLDIGEGYVMDDYCMELSLAG